MTALRAPFPWHGGKRRVADVVWRAFGNPPNYTEPFFGSGAVLLCRPDGPGKIETVNDIDGGICNFWRAVAAAPDEVAGWCDGPVSELDLHARHQWLIGRLETLTNELRSDPHAFDAKVAGWWVWGICQWIGTGWCGGIKRGKPRPSLNSGQGVHAMGLPGLGNDRGVFGISTPPALEWFRLLSERLRRVRVCCGDWTRVVSDAALGRGKNVGGRAPCAVFLDPPYDTELRNKRIYNSDERGLSAQVRDWALEHGDDPDLRIALAGYWDEHREHMPSTWTPFRWKGTRGYAGSDNTNREQETIWFSKHCLSIKTQRSLFEGASP